MGTEGHSLPPLLICRGPESLLCSCFPADAALQLGHVALPPCTLSNHPTAVLGPGETSSPRNCGFIPRNKQEPFPTGFGDAGMVKVDGPWGAA